MKHGKKKILAGALALVLTCLALPGCDSKNADVTKSNIDTDANAIYETKLEHYESLIVDLQEALLNEKEENFIAVCEYKLMIAELEANIKALSEQIDSISVSQNQKKDPQFEQQYKDESIPNSAIEVLIKSDFTYDINSGNITITSYQGNSPQVIIPATINGYPVTAIGEGAFQDCSITTVTLPDSIKTIDWFAFSGCTALSEITIPSSVNNVGYGAFEHCSPSLTIICEKGSYIEAYATSWAMRVKVK